MDSLFRRTQPAHPYRTAQSVALVDYDAFDAPSDDDDDADADDGSGHHTVRAQRGAHSPARSEYSTPSPPAAFGDPLAPAASSSAWPPLATHTARTPRVPGSYDFEQQDEPNHQPTHGPPPSVPLRSHPAALPGVTAYPPSARDPDSAHDQDDDDADRYGRTATAHSAGVLAGWRGIVARLRGQGPASSGAAGQAAHHAESHGLLFSHEESDGTDAEGASGAPARPSYPPGRGAHIPLPARPPQFAPPASSSSGPGTAGGRVFGGGQGNDGVFANLAAKPDTHGDDIVGEGPGKDEVLPAYEAAQLDPSPQYWETTVITPGLYGPDDILVDGLPVGNFFSFAWNLLVSMSFQFVGFLLTFILHTTHAAKNGSRAGLGVTLIQLGFYLKQRVDHPDTYLDPDAPGDETGLNGGLGPADMDAQRWSWWGGFDDPSVDGTGAATATLSALGSLPTQVGGALAGMLDASDPDAVQSALPSLRGDGITDEEMMRISLATNEWLAFLMVTVGSFLLIGSCLAYWRAVRYARAIRQGQGPGADAESMVAA
ncbi:hypothetical protein JCM3770_004522 [Rhodotorula araucariae]